MTWSQARLRLPSTILVEPMTRVTLCSPAPRLSLTDYRGVWEWGGAPRAPGQLVREPGTPSARGLGPLVSNSPSSHLHSPGRGPDSHEFRVTVCILLHLKCIRSGSEWSDQFLSSSSSWEHSFQRHWTWGSMLPLPFSASVMEDKVLKLSVFCFPTSVNVWLIVRQKLPQRFRWGHRLLKHPDQHLTGGRHLAKVGGYEHFLASLPQRAPTLLSKWENQPSITGHHSNSPLWSRDFCDTPPTYCTQ